MLEPMRKLVFYCYVIFLMAFSVWYGYFMYPLIFGFEGKEEAAESLRRLAGEGTEEADILGQLKASEGVTVVNDLGYRVIRQPYIEGRFHHIGFHIEQDMASPCVRCHGSVPHDASKEVRSFLNMHVFYVACETCHVRPEDETTPVDFRWYDKKTGNLTSNPTKLVEIEDSYRSMQDFERKYVTYGNYGAKIAPGRVDQGEFRLLVSRDVLGLVENFLAEQATLGPEQKSQVMKVIHRAVNKEPLKCEGCHTEDAPYIPFAALGYPPRRVSELTNTAVVGMILKYEEFWMPTFLRPGVGSGSDAR